jgi:hypothetical protein
MVELKNPISFTDLGFFYLGYPNKSANCADYRLWHPLKGPCQEKTPPHRKKVQFFFAGTSSSNRVSPFSLPAPVISKVLGADPKLICYQAPIRFKVNGRKI